MHERTGIGGAPSGPLPVPLLTGNWTWEHGSLLILPMDANVRAALHPG
ncbi:hypothetical protein [Kitasatospora sp. NPDC017646]